MGAPKGANHKEEETQHLHPESFSHAHQRSGSAPTGDNHTHAEHEAPCHRCKADRNNKGLARNRQPLEYRAVLYGGKSDGGDRQGYEDRLPQGSTPRKVWVTHRCCETETGFLENKPKAVTREPEKGQYRRTTGKKNNAYDDDCKRPKPKRDLVDLLFSGLSSGTSPYTSRRSSRRSITFAHCILLVNCRYICLLTIIANTQIKVKINRDFFSNFSFFCFYGILFV